MQENDQLAVLFSQHRSRLVAIAYRMLGSMAAADDAVQDTWLRCSRAGIDGVENVGGWLTTITTRVCLNQLRTRDRRREELLDDQLPDPIVRPAESQQPEDEALLADSVSLALLIVLDTLSPPERLAFVLHDLFGLAFNEVASILERSPDATRQLASRARRRVQSTDTTTPSRNFTNERQIVNAFFAASRKGDLDALIAVLDPNVVLRADFGGTQPDTTAVVRGARAVATRARIGARSGRSVRPLLIDDAVGVMISDNDQPFALMSFSFTGEKIVEIKIIGDQSRVRRLMGPLLEQSDGN